MKNKSITCKLGNASFICNISQCNHTIGYITTVLIHFNQGMWANIAACIVGKIDSIPEM